MTGLVRWACRIVRSSLHLPLRMASMLPVAAGVLARSRVPWCQASARRAHLVHDLGVLLLRAHAGLSRGP